MPIKSWFFHLHLYTALSIVTSIFSVHFEVVELLLLKDPLSPLKAKRQGQIGELTVIKVGLVVPVISTVRT
jgi:hypothetical protein